MTSLLVWDALALAKVTNAALLATVALAKDCWVALAALMALAEATLWLSQAPSLHSSAETAADSAALAYFKAYSLLSLALSIASYAYSTKSLMALALAEAAF